MLETIFCMICIYICIYIGYYIRVFEAKKDHIPLAWIKEQIEIIEEVKEKFQLQDNREAYVAAYFGQVGIKNMVDLREVKYAKNNNNWKRW